MLLFLIKRILYGILVLISVVLIVTSIVYLAPVDPAQLTFGQRSDATAIEKKRAQLGLDQPLKWQLINYLNDISFIGFSRPENIENQDLTIFKIASFTASDLVLKRPNLRESYQSGRKVSEIVLEAFKSTFLLAILAMIFAIIPGIMLGILSAVRKGSWIDQLTMTLSVLGYSLPSYIVAILIAFVFGYWLSDWTGLHVQGSLFELDDLGDEHLNWRNIILPAVALGLRPIALITQMTRSALLEVLSQDYIRTARAKGLSPRVILIRHALRNALNPVITAISGWFAGLLAGAFFVEYVFNFSGLGLVTVNALLNFDTPVVLGCVILMGTIFVILNILTDIGYRLIDKRIQII